MTDTQIRKPAPWRNGYTQSVSLNVLREAIQRENNAGSYWSLDVAGNRVQLTYASYSYHGKVQYPMVFTMTATEALRRAESNGDSYDEATAIRLDSSVVFDLPIRFSSCKYLDPNDRMVPDDGDMLADLVVGVWDTAARLMWSPQTGEWESYHVPIYRVQHCSDFDPASAERYGKTIVSPGIVLS